MSLSFPAIRRLLFFPPPYLDELPFPFSRDRSGVNISMVRTYRTFQLSFSYLRGTFLTTASRRRQASLPLLCSSSTASFFFSLLTSVGPLDRAYCPFASGVARCLAFRFFALASSSSPFWPCETATFHWSSILFPPTLELIGSEMSFLYSSFVFLMRLHESSLFLDVRNNA